MTFKKLQALLCVATAVTTLCLAGCKQNEESPNDTSVSDSVSETLPVSNTDISENSASEVTESYYVDTSDLDFHEFFKLDESVEIVDNINDKVFIEGFKEYKYHMEKLKELFAEAINGNWENARKLASSEAGAFDCFENVKISDFKITKVELNKNYERLVSYDITVDVYFDLTVTESDSELFEVGTHPWMARLLLSESNWAEYILPVDEIGTTCMFSEKSSVEMFCYRLATYLGDLKGNDFRDYFKSSSEQELDEFVNAACIVLSYANIPDYDKEYTEETKSPEAFYNNMEKVFGTDLRDIDVTNYREYISSKMIIPIPRGGMWIYASIVGSDVNEAEDTYTVTLDIYSDTICWTVAKTVRYTVSVNSDGSFRLMSAEELYSSGFDAECGSI